MILDYFITVLFFITIGVFFYLFGLALTTKYKLQESTNVLVGFIAHTSVLAVIGMFFQITKLSWHLYFYTTILWLLLCLSYSVYKIKKDKIKIFKNGFREFIKKYWFFLVMIVIFVLSLYCNGGRIWTDNLTDDGYYLVRIANLPYAANSLSYDVTSGFKTLGLDTYVLNTWELETSVFLYICNVLPTIFVRFGLSTFNFVLICCSMHSLIATISKKSNKKIDANNYQYFCFLIMPIFFAMNMFGQSFLNISLEDTWKNTTALFYGSSLVRIAGPLIYFNYIFTVDKIKIRDVIAIIAISIVMVSRSTTALPIIFLIGLSYLFVYFIKNKHYKLLIALLLLTIGASFIFKNNQAVSSYTLNRLVNNAKSIMTIVLLLSILALTIYQKNKKYIQVILMFIFIILLLTIEPINNIYENLTIYDFVSGRTIYSLYLAVYILITIIFSLQIFGNINIVKKVSACGLIACTSIGIVISQHAYDDVISVNPIQSQTDTNRQSLSILKNNMMLTPDSTMNVGKALHELELKNDHRLKVITTFDWLQVDGYAHFPALTYRIYAPNIYNYTARFRLGGELVTTGKYRWDDHEKMRQFANEPNKKNYQEIEEILNEIKFDCIISTNGQLEEYLKEKNYRLYTQIVDNNQTNVYYLYTLNQ